MIKPDGQILVIFGASGDLTKRKLLPSLYELFGLRMFPFQKSLQIIFLLYPEFLIRERSPRNT